MELSKAVDAGEEKTEVGGGEISGDHGGGENHGRKKKGNKITCFEIPLITLTKNKRKINKKTQKGHMAHKE